MRDEDLDRELSALLDGELAPARARQLREEIEANPRLRERLAQFELVDERLRELPQAPLPAQLGARTRERIRQRDAGHYDQHHNQHDGQEAGWPNASIVRWGVPLAAALAAGLVAAWLMRPVSDSHESVRPEQLAGQLGEEPQAEFPVRRRTQQQPQQQPLQQPLQQQPLQQPLQEQTRNQLNPERADAVRRPEAEIEPDDSSEEEIAIALELATLRDLDLIQELDLLEALLAMETTRDGPG